MKEISIEQKAKRYDEALERARELSTSISGAQYDTIFPELKEESEDERIRKALMQNLKERFGTKGNMGEGLDMPDVLAWLEKQGEQILANSAKTCKDEQKPAWSEEDEAMLYSAIAFVEHSAFTTIGKGKGGVVAWLKSLKDRYTWKPSVEQMDALLVKIPIENNCSKVDNILKSLYSDLKRLK